MKQSECNGGNVKTITLSPEGTDQPMWSICMGHVDAKQFNIAHANEGWQADDVTDDELSFEYWVERDGQWLSSHKGDLMAKPVTVMEW